MKIKSFVVLLALALISQASFAVPVLYTDRLAWESTVGSIFTEDFESDPGGYDPVQTPYTTANGFNLSGVSSQFNSMQILPSGTFTVLNNGTQYLHFRDFTAGLEITLPSSTSAFGFDYGASDAGWTLTAANGVSFTFPHGSGTSGFIGFTDTTGMFSSFTLTGPGGAQGGFSIDNISIAAVPEPATIFLFGAGLLVFLGTARKNKLII